MVRRSISFLCTLVAVGATLKEAADPLTMREIPVSTASSYYCPDEFTPPFVLGEFMGFHNENSAYACCLLDKSLGYMELIYRINTCPVYSGFDKGSPCWAGWAG